MSGLNAIIDEIAASAASEAAAIVAEARAEAERAAQAADAEARAAQDACEADCARIREAERARVVSAARMRSGRELLAERGRIVRQTVEDARLALLGLPDEEYLAFVLDAARPALRPGACTARMSARDLARVTPAFAGRLEDAARERGAVLELSSEPAPIDGGIVLDYGDIEENCSLSALLHASSERIEDALVALLFAD